MRILRVIPTMDPRSGGPCQGIRNVTPILNLLGVSTEVVSFDANDSKFVITDDFPIHKLGPSIGPYSYCKGLNIWLLNNFSRFDVVIIHGLWLYNSFGTYRSWIYFKKNNPNNYPKLCVMPHGMLDPYFQKDKSRKLKALRNIIFYKFWESKVINNCNAMLFTCELELQLAKSSFKPYHPLKEINVSYGVKAAPSLNHSITNLLNNQTDLSLPSSPYLLYLSRIHPKKGVDLLISAYTFLSNAFSLPPLVIAGPGLDTSYGQSLQNQALNYPSISFIGMVTGDAKYAAFYGCEAFILPSHQENFGIAVAEALSCGKPVLITKQVNIWPEIINSSAGLAEEDNLEGIIELLQKWINFSEDRKREFSENAYRCYLNNFSIEFSSKKLLDELRNI